MQQITLFLHLIIRLVFIGIGVTLLISENFLPGLEPALRILIGVAFTGYGIFRVYQWVRIYRGQSDRDLPSD